jgi:hypothetical protein
MVALDEVGVDESFELVADQRDRRLARGMRGDAQLRLFAWQVAGLVERDDDIVGRVGARRPRPADVEAEARLLAVRRFQIKAVLAPTDLRGDCRTRVGSDVDGPLGNAPRGFDRLVAPAAVRIVLLIVVADLIERPHDAHARNARARTGR